ncbi:MAG: phosphate regulon transcriptional regulator PhoB [Gammaproteobacteria bacterium]|nr:phosphate regulon transcriptional regulator PhoB [Gammaproteobacteria bacterium]
MTRTIRILVVDDEPAIREMVGFALTREGFEFLEARDAEEAQTRIADDSPDLLLLDWMLPGVSGIDLARRLKSHPDTQELPIIMLTARSDEAHKVKGLEIGADDYVTKPFSPRELVARVRAVLRRAPPRAGDNILAVADIELDPDSHRVTVAGQSLELGPTEFRLLRFLMTHMERVYSRSQLIDLVWGSNAYVEERTVDVHIGRLRKALMPSGHQRLIQTVRSAGYRFSTRE